MSPRKTWWKQWFIFNKFTKALSGRTSTNVIPLVNLRTQWTVIFTNQNKIATFPMCFLYCAHYCCESRTHSGPGVLWSAPNICDWPGNNELWQDHPLLNSPNWPLWWLLGLEGFPGKNIHFQICEIYIAFFVHLLIITEHLRCQGSLWGVDQNQGTHSGAKWRDNINAG